MKYSCYWNIALVNWVEAIVCTADQMTTSHMAAPQLSACEMAASQLTIQSLLAGDDATYGQTYDQFQACVQLQ